MAHQSSSALRERVRQAAETCLGRDGAVGPLELLQQMRLLERVHCDQWRKGHPAVTPLEPWIQGSPKKLRKTYDALLMAGHARADGRDRIRDEVQQVLDTWSLHSHEGGRRLEYR
jgi:hypothetical protein